jgi:hypothetical protein
VQVRKTAYRGRLGASLGRRSRLRLRLRLRSEFEGSFAASIEVRNELSFEASDERSGALSFETSDARSDVTSTEISDGGSDEVDLQVGVPRCSPANSEASFLTSYRGSFSRDSHSQVDEKGEPLAALPSRTD